MTTAALIPQNERGELVRASAGTKEKKPPKNREFWLPQFPPVLFAVLR